MTGKPEKANFSKYGKKFQESLIQLILDDRPFADQIFEVLDNSFLELKYLKSFVGLIKSYREKYGSHPSRDTMLTILRTEIDDEDELIQKQMREYFTRICSSEKNVEGIEHIKEVSLDFCKKQKLKEAMIKSVKLIQSSSYEQVSKIINDALKLGVDNNIGYEYLKDFEERFMIKARNPVSTGWKSIDSLTRGGLGRGELGVCIAPTGAGKSMALVHLGAQAVLDGLTVVHYTLELQETVVATRYDSCITGIDLSEIFGKKDEVLEQIKDLDGKLIVKEYPTKSASTQTIRNHLEKLKRRGENVDMIIVDYGDLLRPVQYLKEKRNELESIYEELRGLAQIFECPIWTASQTNRSGLNAEVITMESISEAFNKCFVADFIFSISRTIEDKVSNEGRVFVAKNRNGPDGLVFPIFMDTKNVKIKILPQTNGAVTVFTKTSKQQAETLKEKYKNFKKAGSAT
jgi:replicative DNA helicase